MSAADRQQRWRAANRDKAEATRRAYAGRPESKERRRAQYRRDNPPPLASGKSKLELQLEWRAANFSRCLFHRCKSAAKRRGLPFDLTVEFVEGLVATMRCSVTGLELVVAERGARDALLPSIDQIEPGAGYLRSNVRVVAWIYNRARGSGTDRQVLEMALALVRQSAMQSVK